MKFPTKTALIVSAFSFTLSAYANSETQSGTETTAQTEEVIEMVGIRKELRHDAGMLIMSRPNSNINLVVRAETTMTNIQSSANMAGSVVDDGIQSWADSKYKERKEHEQEKEKEKEKDQKNTQDKKDTWDYNRDWDRWR